MRADDEGGFEGHVGDHWGVAPPYGAYRGHYGSYTLGQTGSIGSGRLGGWSAVALGGSFDQATPEVSSAGLVDGAEEEETDPLSVPGEEPEVLPRRR